LEANDVMDLVGTISSSSFTQLATFKRRHHSPPYNVLCDSPWGLHPNGAFSCGSPKIKTFIVLKFWIFISSSNQICLEHVRAIFLIAFKKIYNILHTPIGDHLIPILKGLWSGIKFPI
jgi:hypothetical protein